MRSLRGAVWLLIDLIDDLLELDLGSPTRTELMRLRSAALELLFIIRHLALPDAVTLEER